jgi:hypothetical protein
MRRTAVKVGARRSVAIRPGAPMAEHAPSLLEVAGSVLGELDLDVVVDRVLESAPRGRRLIGSSRLGSRNTVAGRLATCREGVACSPS